MDSYSKAAVERAMKVQEMILRALAKKILGGQAAKILGISDRSMRRYRERYEEVAMTGCSISGTAAQSEAVTVTTVELVLGRVNTRLYRDQDFDLNVWHFHEELREMHHIKLSYSWIKAAMQGAGLVERGRERACIASGARGGG